LARAIASAGVCSSQQWQDFFGQDLVKIFRFLEGGVVRRLFEPYKSLAWHVDTLNVCFSQRRRDVPIVVPEQYHFVPVETPPDQVHYPCGARLLAVSRRRPV
jgi:hypothetical protein